MSQSESAASAKVFKPFLVQGGLGGKNIFRVSSLEEGVTRGQVEQFLESLPISFSIKTGISERDEGVNEPIEVYVSGGIVSMYPPKRRVMTYASLGCNQAPELTNRMHVDNLLDLTCPGKGQLRSCIHFDTAIFGIKGWPEVSADNELELDIHAFPKGKESEPQFEIPSIDVRALCELIGGGEKDLTSDQLGKWKGLIMLGVKEMRWCYENPDVSPDYEVRLYYQPYWKKIDEASNDEELSDALGNLCSAIKYK